MNDEHDDDQFELEIQKRREEFERNNTTYALNLTEHEVEVLIRYYCDLNERACIDFDAGRSDFIWYHDRCFYFSRVSGLRARAISEQVHAELARQADEQAEQNNL